MRLPLFRALLCFAFFGEASAAEYNGPKSVAELQTAIEKVLQKTGAPGAAVAIVSHDKTEWIAGLGLAEVASKKPVTTKTVFRIGSISKEFVALAALKLQEEGKLKLTDTLKQWVPEYPVENAWEATDPVRLVHLLEHTSGIPDQRFSELAHNDPTPVTLAQALAFAPQNRVTRWRPGSRYAYTGVGPALAAAVMEKASGQRIEDYVRDNFFLPLGMTSASYFLMPATQTAMATMYWSGTKQPAPYTHHLYRAAGAVSASIEDMANYVRFHLQRGSLDGRRILAESSIDRLERPTTLPAVQAGVTAGYGLYNNVLFVRGYEWHGHDGETDAALSIFLYSPELGLGMAILTNSNDEDAFGEIQGLVLYYLMRDIPAKSLVGSVPMPSAMKQGFDGYYANISPRNEGFTDFSEYFANVRRLHVDEMGMTWESAFGGSPQRWVAVSDKLFRRENSPKPALALIAGENGEPLFQATGGTLQRISGFGFLFVVGGAGVSLVTLVSSVLFALIWVPRKALGRLKSPGPLAVRVWPLVGAVGVLGILIFYSIVQRGWLAVLGTMNAWTVGLMAVSLLVPLSAGLSAVAVWRFRNAPMNRVAYWHAVLGMLALIFISGFALSWDLVGIRLWA